MRCSKTRTVVVYPNLANCNFFFMPRDPDNSLHPGFSAADVSLPFPREKFEFYHLSNPVTCLFLGCSNVLGRAGASLQLTEFIQ